MEGELKFVMENRTNNMNEDWIKWNPINIEEGQYNIIDYTHNVNGVKLILTNEIKKIEVFFDGIPLLIRYSIEGIRMKTWEGVQIKYKNKYFFKNWFLYLIHESQLVNWISTESCGFYDNYNLKHFCIVTGEELIDFISINEPTISLIT